MHWPVLNANISHNHTDMFPLSLTLYFFLRDIPYTRHNEKVEKSAKCSLIEELTKCGLFVF